MEDRIERLEAQVHLLTRVVNDLRMKVSPPEPLHISGTAITEYMELHGVPWEAAETALRNEHG